MKDTKENSSVCYEVSDTSFNWCSNVYFYCDINSCKPSSILLLPPLFPPSIPTPKKGEEEGEGETQIGRELFR